MGMKKTLLWVAGVALILVAGLYTLFVFYGEGRLFSIPLESTSSTLAPVGVQTEAEGVETEGEEEGTLSNPRDPSQKAPASFLLTRGVFLAQGESRDSMPVFNIAESPAQTLCAIFSTMRCAWNNNPILPLSNIGDIAKANKGIFNIEVIKLSKDKFRISFTNKGKAEYVLPFVIQRDRLNRVHGVFDAHIEKMEAEGNTGHIFWDAHIELTESTGDTLLERGVYIAKLHPDTYDIVLFGVDSGRFDWVSVTIEDTEKKPLLDLRPYIGEHLSLFNPQWNGSGSFIDGGGGYDTVSMKNSKRGETDIFRGVDHPDKGHLNVIVISGWNRTQVLTNIEKLEFADGDIEVYQLIEELEASGGILLSERDMPENDWWQ